MQKEHFSGENENYQVDNSIKDQNGNTPEDKEASGEAIEIMVNNLEMELFGFRYIP